MRSEWEFQGNFKVTGILKRPWANSGAACKLRLRETRYSAALDDLSRQ
jgi:hypothetical protein